jgi:hypothetical protein
MPSLLRSGKLSLHLLEIITRIFDDFAKSSPSIGLFRP